MTILIANTKARIRGSKNSWSCSPDSGYSGSGVECAVELEINGNEKDGYHFIMTPDGFFTADTWHVSLQEALEQGRNIFGINSSNWEQTEKD